MSFFATPMPWDVHTCRLFNAVNRRPTIARVFALISRLGDGVFWYSLMLLLPLMDGWDGGLLSLRMAATGALGTLIYRLLKDGIQRPRPCDTFEVVRTVEPLDRFSFPSGHTLHACSFTIMVGAVYPTLGLLLAPFTILVAFSRMILGLHYPTDVLCGAAIGISLGVSSNALALLV